MYVKYNVAEVENQYWYYAANFGGLYSGVEPGFVRSGIKH